MSPSPTDGSSLNMSYWSHSELHGLVEWSHCHCRLMPLVLESLHAYDVQSRAAASALLLIVVRCTHPRIGAHAVFLWGHLLSAFCRDAPEALESRRRRLRQQVEEGRGDGVQLGQGSNAGGDNTDGTQSEVDEADTWLLEYSPVAAGATSHSPAHSLPGSSNTMGTREVPAPTDLESQVVHNILLVCRVLLASRGLSEGPWCAGFLDAVRSSRRGDPNGGSLQRFVLRLFGHSPRHLTA